ncbi:cohesin domain-containing protein [Paenibacillus sp. HWE-109]|uniref:golvesin C-terminal-like domain-containing protein n=1 Tax=Paenibacillus sp. HWE-109 TaxID=1306526 RepID=UPI001EDECD21|nr:right-handed parallel beta-helix repeat-containing protein [Paenibacillus sp. HWE-109]UKS24125.1 cohesin domain-containing protein [Paenibacillus sp. HWE-109]
MIRKIVLQCMMWLILSIIFAAVSYAKEIVIDNGDAGYSETGTWSSSSVKGYNGTNTRYSNVGVRTAQWTPNIVEAGEYEVFIFKIMNSTAGDKDVDIDVVYDGGTISTEQDWTTGTSGWVSLGKYPFAAGTTGYVIMNGELSGSTTYSRADAVKFVNNTLPPAPPVHNAPVGTYYVDSINGNDANNGTSEGSAWKTLDKVNFYTYQPGTTILLRSGSYWVGQLKPLGSGSAGSPIIINKYGTGNKPIIDGNGITNAGVVHLYNQQYWEINNLEVMNDASTADTRFGIYIQLDNYGTANHIYVKDCYVHNVKGDNSNPHKGVGIFYFVTSADTSIFNDILIENNTVKSVDRSGIILRNPNGTYSTGLVIRNNFVEDIGGDGIVAKTSKAPLVEYNIAKDTSARANNANAAIWTWYTDDSIVQYNESYNTVRLPNNLDANGFDSDFNNNRSIFQYNYSHDNGGGFILVINPTGSYNNSTIVRYNISQNDEEKVINLLGDITNTQFYNNTFYLDSSSTAKMIEVRNYFGVPKNTNFSNNIFYNSGSGVFDLRKVDNFSFDSNIFYGMAPPVPTAETEITVVNAITSDPKLVNPGTGGSNINFNDPNRLSGYKLQADSPAINAGVVIANNGGKDFWGSPLYNGQPDIGASEQEQTSLPPNVPHAVLTGPSTVQKGTSFTTNIGLNNVTNSVYSAVYAADIIVKIDVNAIEFASVESLKPGFTVLQTQTNIPGQIRIIAVSEGAEGALTTSGDVFKINWKAKSLDQPLTTNLALSKVIVANALGQKTESIPANLTISITTSRPGDANGDGVIDIGDLGKVAANYGMTSANANWNQVRDGDVNLDGKIDVIDLVGIARLILE